MPALSMNDIKTQLKELSEQVNSLAASNYKCWRDEQANLHIDFADGFSLQIPHHPFRNYQIELQQKMFIEGYLRSLLERPRRAGKEYESWNILLSGAVETPGLYLMVYPTSVRARAVLWEGNIILPNGNSVSFLDMIPARLLEKRNEQEMRIKLVNGSVIWILGSDIQPDKLRGTNPRGIVFSELAFQDPYVLHIMLPVLRQNNGWLIGQSTFSGRNHFWRMIEHNKLDPKWYCRVDSINTLLDDDGNPYITDEMVQEDRNAGMPEYLIQQEYYGNVEINQESKYFAHALNNLYESERIIPGLYLPNKNLYAAYDLGIDDSQAIILFQIRRVGEYLAPVIIDYMEDNNKDLAFYINWCRNRAQRRNLPLKRHYIPHDGKKRDPMLRDYTDYGRDFGEEFIVVPRPNNKNHAIEGMRRMLYIAEFNQDTTQRLLDCLADYSKEYDEAHEVWKKNPVHGWSSHGVDSFQTMMLALELKLVNDRPAEIVYYNNG